MSLSEGAVKETDRVSKVTSTIELKFQVWHYWLRHLFSKCIIKALQILFKA